MRPKLLGWSALIAALISGIEWAYMTQLRVPAVMAVRPELKEVGFWTGVFSGRSNTYLFYHHEVGMVAFSFVFLTLLCWLWVEMKL